MPIAPFALSVVDKDDESRRRSGPLVTKILLPFRMYLAPFLTAVVARLKASEPLFGSLIALPPMSEPLQSPGRNFSFAPRCRCRGAE